MKKLIVCILALIVLAGCVQPPADEGAEEAAPKTTVKDTTEAKETTAASTILGEEIGGAIDEQLVPGVKSVIPVNYKKMKYGDTFVFGIGIRNTFNLPDDFLVSVYFDKAYDKYMNVIDTDEDTMNSWIKTKFEPFTLDQDETQAVSVVMEVGYTMSGVKPAAGTYVFDVETLSKKGGSRINKEHVGKREISIKIEK
jgi:hypothetical protein